jgi:hypothetical protein
MTRDRCQKVSVQLGQLMHHGDLTATYTYFPLIARYASPVGIMHVHRVSLRKDSDDSCIYKMK